MKKYYFIFLIVILSSFNIFSQSQIFKVDYIDSSKFKTKNLVRLFVNFYDSTYSIVDSFDPTELKISANNKKLKGKFEKKQLKDVGGNYALLIIMTANNAYRTPLDEGKPSPFKLEQKGIVSLLQSLKSNISFKVAIYIVFEDVSNRIISFTDPVTAAKNVGSFVIDKEKYGTNKYGNEGNPLLYRNIQKIISKEFVDNESEELPYKKMVIVMSDGRDRYLARKKSINKRIDNIRQMINENGLFLRIHTIFYSPGPQDGETTFAQLSNISNGINMKIPAETEIVNINDYFEKFSNLIKKQYVVNFYPEDLSGGQKVKFEIKYPGLAPYTYPSEVELAKRPIPWKKILFIILGIVGGLLVIFIIFKVIAGIIAGREDDDDEEEEEEYTGPYKGTLKSIEGPTTGATYYLNAVRMTLGKMEGNDIVIEDPTISRKHAAIRIESMRFELADVGSANGTFVNGHRITKQYLKDGDRIKMGETVLIFNVAKL